VSGISGKLKEGIYTLLQFYIIADTMTIRNDQVQSMYNEERKESFEIHLEQLLEHIIYIFSRLFFLQMPDNKWIPY